jgi:hypothetical protein
MFIDLVKSVKNTNDISSDSGKSSGSGGGKNSGIDSSLAPTEIMLN